jgi:GMP synthase-like glutamine amidotransferase
MNIHCIRHEPFEGLASIESWVRNKGHGITYTRTYLNQRFPDEITFDILIIMGGSASVYEPGAKGWIGTEIKFIKKVIDSGKTVIGICLGAQLLAHLYGAKVYLAPKKEIGWFPVHFNKKELSDFYFLPDHIHTFHWHGDTFDLPYGAIRVASSLNTPNQGFLMGDKVLALQFHLEMNLSGLKKLIKACGHDLTKNGSFIQTAESMIVQTEFYSQNNQLMFSLLNFLGNRINR